MSERQRGLGRGLSALLGEAALESAEAPAGAAAAPGPMETPIELIRRNPDQPRRTFTEAQIGELADSIREKGVLQPILVRPAPGAAGEFQIVAGERRWRAAQKAGLATIPALVRELDDRQVLEIGIVENIQRADLNPVEEALGYRALMERFGRTQEALSQIVGKSRSHVANTLRLLNLPEPVRDHLVEGRLSAGHARALLMAADPEALAERAVAEGLSVRQVEALVRGGAAPRPQAPRGAGARGGGHKSADTQALERDLSDELGLQVSLEDRDGRGTLSIRYDTLEQLDELCRRLTRG